MKKTLIFILVFVLSTICFASTSFASSKITATDCVFDCNEIKTIKTDDGGCISIVLVTKNSTKASGIKDGTKYVTRQDSNGNIVWRYGLTATFSYIPGVSSTCTNATYSVENNSSIWSFSDGSTSISGNVAHGYGKFERKLLGLIVLETNNIDISLTCDTYGNLS